MGTKAIAENDAGQLKIFRGCTVKIEVKVTDANGGTFCLWCALGSASHIHSFFLLLSLEEI